VEKKGRGNTYKWIVKWPRLLTLPLFNGREDMQVPMVQIADKAIVGEIMCIKTFYPSPIYSNYYSHCGIQSIMDDWKTLNKEFLHRFRPHVCIIEGQH